MTILTQSDKHSAPAVLPVTGLTQAEVQARVARNETNAFELRVGRTYWQIISHNLLNSFNLVLFVMLLVVLISQDYGTVLFAGFSVVTNSLIGTVQEINAKRKLQKLARLASQQVFVLRDGRRQSIPSQEIVKDDVLIVEPGDKLVADGTIIVSDSLEIDESHLTGESDAIYKSVDDPVYSGSFCIAGTGLMVATKVGAQSTVNRLSSIASRYKNILTPTQKKVAAVVHMTLVALAIFGPMLVVAGYRSDITFLEIVRNTIVFSTSLVPQGLILVITLSLTIGAVRISLKKTLIQRINAVESLANVTVLCFDKTGTITQNKLEVTEIIPLGENQQPNVEHDLHVYIHNIAHQNSTAAAVARHLLHRPHPNSLPPKQREIPFNSARKWGAIILGDRTLVLGAPERVLGHDSVYLDWVEQLSRKGLRVLAFAELPHPPKEVLEVDHARALALVVIRDQMREDIQETLQSFRDQNVRLKVISGDNVQTVRAICSLAGMDVSEIYTGDQIKAMSDPELESVVLDADVYARIEPDTKRRIVAALKAQGHHVAMVGDGVNDVPALKAADLAIVMNDGAQISKDIGDIVLLNNAMSTLPLAFKEGTDITQKIYGTTKMFLTKNVYNTLLFICVLYMALPFPITPIQISWAAFGTINIVGGLVAVGLIRPAKIKNFRDDVLDYIITAGMTGAVAMAIMYLITIYYLDDVFIARSAMTIFFILYSMTITWNVHGADVMRPRSLIRNPHIVWSTLLLTGGALAAATSLPKTFEFAWPPAEILGLILLMHVLSVLLTHAGMHNRGLLRQFYRIMER